MCDSLLVYIAENSNAYLPTRATPMSVGADLRTPTDVVVATDGPTYIDLGIRIIIPMGCYGRIAPKSGVTLKYATTVGAGVIDPDFQGTLGVVLFNHSQKPYTLPRGTAVAQLICEQCIIPEIVRKTTWDQKATVRGEKGFGSSDE